MNGYYHRNFYNSNQRQYQNHQQQHQQEYNRGRCQNQHQYTQGFGTLTLTPMIKVLILRDYYCNNIRN